MFILFFQIFTSTQAWNNKIYVLLQAVFQEPPFKQNYFTPSINIVIVNISIK